MARTSVTTWYAGFLFVLMVIFVTGELHGKREGTVQKSELGGNGELRAVDQLTEKRDATLNTDTEKLAQNGKTTGSRDLGKGLVKEENTLSGKGNLEEPKGRLKGTESINVADGLVTADLGVKPRGNLNKKTLKVTGTGSVGVAGVKENVGGKPQLNLQNEETPTYENQSNGKGKATTEEPPKNYGH
ncbi:hypothetical protein MKW98_019044 [Papaver atlanticum]|uniref:Uncharacterized protein n=1 Tax=Papaver atlanticum TaxID=357466 RepID=A0AAD4TJD7_9MAGN|nr:hypothetical protein MKW98_019044 [Papaver atlanticum]